MMATRKRNMPGRFIKSRWIYLVAVGCAVVLGLSSRSFSSVLPAFVSSHFGDALWAGMIYFGLRFLFKSQSCLSVARASLLFCFAVEFSQLYQAGWINEIRQSRLGALVLGQGFLVVDLIRYTAGVSVCFLLDSYLLRKISPTDREKE